jgi:hypothetical protein
LTIPDVILVDLAAGTCCAAYSYDGGRWRRSMPSVNVRPLKWTKQLGGKALGIDPV